MRTRGERKICWWALRLPAVIMLAIAAVVALWPAPAAAWWNDQWTQRKKITIDTGASGVGISDPIGTAPVLVRLHLGNFRFGSAKEDGGDLRFVASDDKTPLRFHVEKFDSLLGEALLWVSVPDLRPGAKTDFWLYFGNPKAPGATDAKGTYDPDTLLVYHFAERGTPAQDSSVWANSAQSVVPIDDGSIIGQGARFDGQTTLTLPGSPSLVVPDGGALTWSAWVKMAAPQPRAVLYSRHEGASSLLIGLENGVPFVELTNAGSVLHGGEGAPIAAETWHHLAMTADNGQIILYLDGSPTTTLAATLPNMTGTALLGGDAPVPAAAPSAPDGAPPAETAGGNPPEAAGAAAAPGSTGFVGVIDELQIAKVARPAGFIKFAAIGQGSEQAKLISYSVDEETASWFGGGYFAIILKSVTLDGWVVIGMLTIMAMVSWIVMITKIAYLNRVARANALFLKHFGEAAVDLDSLLHLDEAEEGVAGLGDLVAKKDRKTIRNSTLYRLFHRGMQEIRRRFSVEGRARTLSAQSIQAIRAALDSNYVRETQRLNRAMVVLTIAISGGPFLGLLGTVIGVMITFAAIAATGDVNINAIAPGISAALVATVAGLGVAIPALFGYNYLITRIKETTSDMHVFIDEFVTRMAESYHVLTDDPQRIAAE
jgi:biopolymer transport protein ExbB